MGDLEMHHLHGSCSIFLFLCGTLSFLFPCSFVVIAAPQPPVSDASAALSKFPLMTPSIGSGPTSKGPAANQSILSKSSPRTLHEKSSGKRVRRSNWKSNGKNRGARSHDQGPNSQQYSHAKASSGSHEDEPYERNLYLLLAQHEAKCLDEFSPRACAKGKLEPAISFEFPQDLLRPFVCLEGSRSFSACEQCIQIGRKARVTNTATQANNCQNICRISSALPNCPERCEEFVQSLTNRMKLVTNKTDNAGKDELNGESRRKQDEIRDGTTQVNRRDDATGGRDSSNFNLTTTAFCESVVQFFRIVQTTTDSVMTTSLTDQKVEVFYRHFVYLKSFFSGGGDETVATRDLPMVFVIEQRTFLVNASEPAAGDERGQWTGWRVLGKSPYGFEKIQVALGQETYQWRVTAVGVHGAIATSIVPSFETLNGYMEPGPPRRVFVIEMRTKESSVDVLLGWDPPEDRACFYKIVLETGNQAEFSRTVRIKGEPLGVHKVWFKRLKFDSTYQVRVTSRSPIWDEDESTQASFRFNTPACLDTHHFRFDKCAPPPPRNLSFMVQPMGSSNNTTGTPVSPTKIPKRYFTAHLSWESPAHASATNLIEEYVLDIIAFSWNPHSHNSSGRELIHSRSDLMDPNLPAPTRINLPGNVTHAKVDNLVETVEYTVLVSAYSSKGSSPPATLTVKFHSDLGSGDTSVGLWVYPSCGFVVMALMVASGYRAVRTVSRRRKMRAARDSYFKSIDQRDAYDEDWSVLSLTEDPNRSTWTEMEEICDFPTDKLFHFRLQDFTIEDIVGQGAFGIVRKAKIRSDKYLELQQQRHNRETHLDSQHQVSSSALGDDDDTEMKTVALKILKAPASAKADREDAMKELMTMQTLGEHSHIVTLLGVCTTPKSMYLVLEYCPQGDLLSFLTKFREKYLPLLNLESGGVGGDKFENLQYKSYENGEIFMTKNSGEIGVDLEEDRCRTGLHHETSSSSPGPPRGSQAVDNDPPGGGSDGAETCECDFISEKDALSYARQVALGMAHLERNHVVHRDLACRNVLIMADHRRVKISDFGLSRDIYTRNIYDQKSVRKLPLKWMALESITSRIFSSKSDVWSYGILLWELVTLGAVPYPAVENQELFNLLRTGYRMERPDNCSEELYALMRKCWRVTPADRPNFPQLISYLETMIETEPDLYLTFRP